MTPGQAAYDTFTRHTDASGTARSWAGLTEASRAVWREIAEAAAALAVVPVLHRVNLGYLSELRCLLPASADAQTVVQCAEMVARASVCVLQGEKLPAGMGGEREPEQGSAGASPHHL